MFDHVRADTRRLTEFKERGFPGYLVESLLFENGYQAVVLYRIARWFKRRRVPVLPAFFHRLSMFLTGVDINPGAEIGPGLLIAHGTGLVIGGRVVVGADAILLHQATIGGSGRDTRDAMPTIGDRAFIGAGARVIGGITVGDDVFIGVNVVVTRDVPANTRIVSKAEVETGPRNGWI
jgi:serine O-acetyltransferase